MKILAPLSSKNNISTLVEAGADEFFCGVIDKQWDERFGVMGLNRRSNQKDKSNFSSTEELAEAINITHQFNRKLFLTLNHHQYTNSQLPYLKVLVNEFKRVGGDGIIVADPNVLEFGKEMGLNVTISTVWNVYNSETVKFLKSMGADRIILSRDMNLEDIRRIRDISPDIEIEVFIMNESCKFSDSMCLPIHATKWGSFCNFLDTCRYKYFRYDNKEINFNEEHGLQVNNFYYHRFLLRGACGLCTIWRLLQYKIDACKVVGRFYPVEKIKEDVALVKKNIEIAGKCKTEAEYIENMEMPFKYEDRCNWGFRCYFPETFSDFGDKHTIRGV